MIFNVNYLSVLFFFRYRHHAQHESIFALHIFVGIGTDVISKMSSIQRVRSEMAQAGEIPQN